ncbi:hypothetical protein CNECB9_2680003 [Cupriavidus necator]|uniref:Uncharacterized protein n=1 Tax=Cupriavidus necator TaxID=106590 RepID=A0A1K0IGE3_CUPNE|nr:hypothetical protein CNECB9_2680003 [Cupriavidus necator]
MPERAGRVWAVRNGCDGVPSLPLAADERCRNFVRDHADVNCWPAQLPCPYNGGLNP